MFLIGSPGWEDDNLRAEAVKLLIHINGVALALPGDQYAPITRF